MKAGNGRKVQCGRQVTASKEATDGNRNRGSSMRCAGTCFWSRKRRRRIVKRDYEQKVEEEVVT